MVCRKRAPGIVVGMGWEESMFAVFDDLEQQAEGLHLAERDAEVADLTVAEYSRISLAARLHASLGLDVRVRLIGGHVIAGRLSRMGDGWVLLVDRSAEWIVRCEGVLSVAGLSTRADNEDTWPVIDRLTLRAVLRRIATSGEGCQVLFVDDQQVEGRVGRVGRDFFELVVGEGADRVGQVVPLTSVAALQERPR
jgi:hypothetical protein